MRVVFLVVSQLNDAVRTLQINHTELAVQLSYRCIVMCKIADNTNRNLKNEQLLSKYTCIALHTWSHLE